MNFISRRVLLFAFAGWVATAAYAQTVTGAQAQKSPQAEAFLAYEKALLAGGLDAATPHMTPEKLDELKGMVKMFGEDGFKQFLDKMRGGAQGEARRKQINKVDVNGDHAVLEARDGPNAVTVQHLARVKDGWKVTVRK
jgi:hypothetical protein